MNFGHQKKLTAKEQQMVRRAAEQIKNELAGIRLDNVSARAVCEAADDLQKNGCGHRESRLLVRNHARGM
jgi:hypothetical protein